MLVARPEPTQSCCYSQSCLLLGQSHSVWTQSYYSQGSLVRAVRCWVRAARSEVRGQSYSVIPTQSELLGHQGQYAARSELLSAVDLMPPNYSWVIQSMKTDGADLLTPQDRIELLTKWVGFHHCHFQEYHKIDSLHIERISQATEHWERLGWALCSIHNNNKIMGK